MKSSCLLIFPTHLFCLQVVAKKRRDRGLPRAFEIFTDSKTYVLKAQDEKHAEEWLQCINVAVAQAKERENRETTTYLWERHRPRRRRGRERAAKHTLTSTCTIFVSCKHLQDGGIKKTPAGDSEKKN